MDLLQHNSQRLINNNFDLLRLLFAGTVCLVHAYEVSGFQALGGIASVLSSAIAVKSFFVVSGFLIFMSFERSRSLGSYASKRIRRIYPAYFTIVMLCALGFVAVSTLSTADYFSLPWLKYVAANLTFMNFLQPALPGVFASNPMDAVNGALWTLKIEVMFYLSVPVFVILFRRFSPLPVIAAVYCVSMAYAWLCTMMAERTGSTAYLELARQLPGQLSYFMAGAFFYYYLPLFERKHFHFLILAMAVMAGRFFYPLPFLEPVALAAIVIFFALYLYMGNFGKYGDFSYGVYIVHFPIIQLLLGSGRFAETPWLFLLTVVLLTAAWAIALWHLVEKRFLLRGSHYVVAAIPADEEATAT